MEGAGQFINSFDSANYEVSLKRVEEKKEGDDPRTQRHEKNVETYTVHLEDESIMTSEPYLFQMAAASATSACKRLCRTRGSEADPEWMAAEALKIAKNYPGIKEIRMLKGEELAQNGMNLFWNVGKGAACKPVCVMINYKGRDDTEEVDFAIVGKGVTYDTGGLNIKL
jgi:leucyl aminopeptidase